MIVYKTRDEIELIKESSLLVSKTLGEINKIIEPGITPLELDKFAETFIRDHKATPGFLGLYGFPNTLCVSVNEQVVHGIPTNSPLKNGDIVSVDCGVKKNNYFGDHAYTFEVGEVSKEIKKLLKVTKESLYLGIKELKVGNTGLIVFQLITVILKVCATQKTRAETNTPPIQLTRIMKCRSSIWASKAD